MYRNDRERVKNQSKNAKEEKNVVSLVIPVYNGADSLEKCLQSIEKQTYPYWEVVVVDDGSQDHSVAIMEQWAKKDSRIRYFHKENQGVSATRNYGISQASGSYLMFVDCDDTMAENYVETMVAALEKSGADLGIAGYTRIKNGERSQQKVKNHTYPLADGTFVADFFQLYNAWLLHMPWNKIYKRELIGALTFPLDKSLGEDLLFNLAYMEQCKKIQTVDSCGYQYVIAMAGSLATTFREDKMENSLDLHRSVWQFAENMFGRQKVAQQGDSRLMKELHAYLRQLLLTDGKTWNEKKKIMKHYFSHPVIRENYKNLSKKNGADGMLAKFCIKKQFIPYCTLLVIGAWAKKQVQRKMWIKQMVFK